MLICLYKYVGASRKPADPYDLAPRSAAPGLAEKEGRRGYRGE